MFRIYFVALKSLIDMDTNSEKLKNSKYGTPDTLDHITKRFDETTKRLFRDKNDLQYIPFGSPLDKDLKVGIRGGQLKLTGYAFDSFVYYTFTYSRFLVSK